MRTVRLVHGDPVHRAAFPETQGSAPYRQYFPVDVPHLRLRLPAGALQTAFSTPAHQSSQARTVLYGNDLHCGISQRTLFMEAQALPLGLREKPFSHPPHHPAGLCSLVVPGRALLRADPALIRVRASTLLYCIIAWLLPAYAPRELFCPAPFSSSGNDKRSTGKFPLSAMRWHWRSIPPHNSSDVLL